MSNVLKEGRCRLCLKETNLCNSHIIPEFLYEPLYNSKHQFFRISTTGKAIKRPFEQKGVREYLLCVDCERQFSRYEDYAKRVLYGGARITMTIHDAGRFEAQVEYQKFKLFELSLFWRMGITSVPEFKDVHLGSHERRLRKMLREEKPGETTEYGCVLTLPVSHCEIVDQLIMSMGMVKIQKVRCCRLVLPSMCWFFFLSRKDAGRWQEDLFLQSEGLLRILRGDFGIDDFFKNLAHNLDNAGKGPQ